MQKFKTSIQSTSMNLRQQSVKISINRYETKWGEASTGNNNTTVSQNIK